MIVLLLMIGGLSRVFILCWNVLLCIVLIGVSWYCSVCFFGYRLSVSRLVSVVFSVLVII